MSMIYKPRKGPRDQASLLEGMVELWAYKKDSSGEKQLFDYQRVKNIVLYQGNAEIVRAISSVNPPTPRLITRMAIGDQGTQPSDSTAPKPPLKTASTLYHEIYRKDIDARVMTLYTPAGYSYQGNTTGGSNIITVTSSAGIVLGMTVSGTGIPSGSVVVEVTTGTQIKISAAATSTNTGITISFAGTINECQFSATFSAADVDVSAFANPSTPRVNEVGLVIVNPNANGIVRNAVTAPNDNFSDEVLMTVRTFKSVPFEKANDVSITIRYTIFTE